MASHQKQNNLPKLIFKSAVQPKSESLFLFLARKKVGPYFHFSSCILCIYEYPKPQLPEVIPLRMREYPITLINIIKVLNVIFVRTSSSFSN